MFKPQRLVENPSKCGTSHFLPIAGFVAIFNGANNPSEKSLNASFFCSSCHVIPQHLALDSTLGVKPVITTLLSSLIIAFLSGLTFLAYKHSIAFKRLYWPICFLVTCVFLAFLVWNSAINAVLSALKDFIPTAQLQAATLKAHELDFPAWHPLAFLASIIYIVFLLWLPNLLADDSGKEKPKDE